MDLAYVCEWEKWPKSTHCPSVPLACAWSCRNLIAFTTDLRSDDQDLTRTIHILDTEHPWDVHSVSSQHREAITCLEWDQSGSRLLSADADGQIKCWSMADHLANSWESCLGSMVEGDPIVALSWLHNGVKLALHVEKSGASSFGEKFSRVKFSPSLTLFGGKPMEGWIAVTVSGLVTVSLLKPSGQVLTSTESLCRLRGRVALADIAFTGGGNIVVATADGSSASPVQFYKVCVSVVSEKCRIDTEILPSLFMRCTTDLSRKDKFPAITHLKFLARDMSEQVLLCASKRLVGKPRCYGLPTGLLWGVSTPGPGGILSPPALLHTFVPQVLSTRILAMKASLCRLSPCTVTRVCDYHTKLFLMAVSSTLKSLLCPHFLNTPDKSPGDRLTEICAKITDVDIDKVMINLKTEEFVLDMNTLQALQQLLQWVGDFVLYLLASLPNQVCRGPTSKSPLPLPTFPPPSPASTPATPLPPPPQAPPRYLMVGGDPLSTCGLTLLPSLALCPGPHASPPVPRAPGQPKMDHLRRLHLGAYPTEECKACTRCGCVTMLRSPNKTTAVKQWEQRWIKNCLCGGLWRRTPPSCP
ncbi:mediator of RNA polymerase II transcription subunit 16 [Marmota marmota marmota]|uniref:mediator of RNA polymerase II transcription subunit 16 n=1 Tax=Marmota marmota marmota TaxID=9994 RepID=UPI002093871A|nr:mediator of RNA polymerase II transcription subunit 16 [Marmota marmota marmota]